MLNKSLRRGVEGKLNIDRTRLLNHVRETIRSADGFAKVLIHDGKAIGCFMAEVSEHAYCRGYVAQELGVFIDDEHRGSTHFQLLLTAYLEWVDIKPDVILTTFTIGQLGATTPYLRHLLKQNGFKKGDEGYYKR